MIPARYLTPAAGIARNLVHQRQRQLPHRGLHHHRGLVRLRPDVRDFCRLNPVHFAAGEAGLAIIETLSLANRHREPVYRPLQSQKRSQYFICADDETLSVAMRVNNRGKPN